MFYAFSDKLPHRGISVSSFIESVSAPILKLLFPSDLEQKRNMTKKSNFSQISVNWKKKNKQTKKEIEIEKKKQKRKRQRKLGKGLSRILTQGKMRML